GVRVAGVAGRDPASLPVALKEVQPAAAGVLREEQAALPFRVGVRQVRHAGVLVEPEDRARLALLVVETHGRRAVQMEPRLALGSDDQRAAELTVAVAEGEHRPAVPLDRVLLARALVGVTETDRPRTDHDSN